MIRLAVDVIPSNNVTTNTTATNIMNNVVSVATDFSSLAINSKLPIFRKEGHDDSSSAIAALGSRMKDDSQQQMNKKIMLVMVIGGLSYLELAAFRYLSSDPSFPFKIIVATTKLMNGANLLSTLHHRQ